MKVDTVQDGDVMSKNANEPKSDNSTKEWFDSLELTASSRVAIVMHDTPDPDAIGSALCLQWILRRRFQCESTLFYNGSVSHPQNKTMVNLLGIDMKRIASMEEEEGEYALKLVVDSTPSTWSRTRDYPDMEFDAYFDHHPKSAPPKGWKGHAVYRHYGSCCTIMWEIMQELGLSFDMESEDDQGIASAMVVGIRTDTDEMSSDDTSDSDLQALSGLHPYVIQKQLRQIIRYPVPKHWYDLRKQAEGAVKEESNIMATGLGFLSPESRDALAWVADDLARRDGIDTCVAFGIISDQIVGVVRCSSPTLELNDFVGKVFGESTGGGKRGKAAASAPLGPFFGNYTEQTKESIWNAVSSLTMERVFQAASGK